MVKRVPPKRPLCGPQGRSARPRGLRGLNRRVACGARWSGAPCCVKEIGPLKGLVVANCNHPTNGPGPPRPSVRCGCHRQTRCARSLWQRARESPARRWGLPPASCSELLLLSQAQCHPGNRPTPAAAPQHESLATLWACAPGADMADNRNRGAGSKQGVVVIEGLYAPCGPSYPGVVGKRPSTHPPHARRLLTGRDHPPMGHPCHQCMLPGCEIRAFDPRRRVATAALPAVPRHALGRRRRPEDSLGRRRRPPRGRGPYRASLRVKQSQPPRGACLHGHLQ